MKAAFDWDPSIKYRIIYSICILGNEEIDGAMQETDYIQLDIFIDMKSLDDTDPDAAFNLIS